jgi:tRNA pseudouridine13 synthase
MPDIPQYPYGKPQISGLLKSRPEDFIVTEELGFEPNGEGEHLFLFIEKVGLSTHELINNVAEIYQLRPRDIGYSGLKDKHALCRQWLSLHLPGKEADSSIDKGDGFKILKAVRNRSKLRPGTHKSNHFEICLREVSVLPEASELQLSSIEKQGFANYFGEQRFGRNQDNVQQALKQLGRGRVPRQRKGILISSLRSFLFNQILSRRLQLGHWELPLDGDVFMLSGTRSIFSEPVDQALLERYQSMDISSSSSLYGKGRNQMSGQAAEIEEAVFSEHPAITQCLEDQSAKLEMRALRVRPREFEYHFEGGQELLNIRLSLPSGSYLTTLLDHFIETRQVR